MSKFLATRFVDKSGIENNKRDLYEYGFFILISQLYCFIVTILCAIILNIIFPSIIFFLCFLSLRMFSGGYHAKTENGCQVFSTVSLIVSVVLLKLLVINEVSSLVIVVSTLLMGIIIIIFCPIDSKEKPLSEEEYNHFKKITFYIVLVIDISTIVSLFIGNSTIIYSCCISIFLEDVFVIMGLIQRKNKQV